MRRRWQTTPWGLTATAAVLACCTSLPESTQAPSFTKKYGAYTYAEITPVRQSQQKSCGLAALACVLTYWDKPVTEKALLAKHPVPEKSRGHSLQRLQAIAQEHGLLAFAVGMNTGPEPPEQQLSSHIAKGRPIIVALYCPQGRYFGDPVPIIETWDASTFRPLGLVPTADGRAYKHHYVVVFGENAQRYLLMDPAYGIVSVDKRSFLKWWKDEGYASLVCAPS